MAVNARPELGCVVPSAPFFCTRRWRRRVRHLVGGFTCILLILDVYDKSEIKFHKNRISQSSLMGMSNLFVVCYFQRQRRHLHHDRQCGGRGYEREPMRYFVNAPRAVSKAYVLSL